MPGPGMLSTVEVFLAALCATIPLFWPAVRDQFYKIFVQYDFSVSEIRIEDDEFELTKTGSLPAGRGQNEPWSDKTWSEKIQTRTTAKPAYKDDFAMEHVSSYDAGNDMYSGGTRSQVISKKPGNRF
jgi:hypothetical protein